MTDRLWDTLRRDWALPLILVLFVTLGSVYSVVDPAFEASDELWHYPTAKHIADGHGLPVMPPGPNDMWNQEGTQPPLYYLLGAAATFWVDSGPGDAIYQPNPHARVGIPHADGNKNMVLHGPADEFPWSGPVLAVHIVRFLSVLMGAATVWAAWSLGRLLAPDKRWLAPGAAAFVAFNPMFLFISGSVNNDNLTVALCAWALALLVRIHQGQRRGRRLIGLGLLCGAAAISKLSGLGLLPLAALVFFWEAWRKRSPICFLYEGGTVFGVTALVGGWWYVRNWFLYGDPTALSPFLDVVGRRAPQPGVLDLLASEFQGARISFWGLFGGVNVLMAEYAYILLDILSVLALFGLGLALVRAWQDRRLRVDAPWALPVLWCGIIGVSFVRWTQTTLASQGRLVFPAITAIAVLFVLGLANTIPHAWRARAVTAFAVGLFALAAATPFLWLGPAYARPASLTGEEITAAPNPVHIIWNGEFELLGYRLDKGDVKPGEDLVVTLYWRALKPMAANHSLFIQVHGKGNALVGAVDSFPGRGSLPTSEFHVGEAIADTYRVPIRGDAAGPAMGRIHVGLYDYPNVDKRIEARDGQGNPIGVTPLITNFRLAGPPVSIPATAKRLDYKLGESIALDAATLVPAAPGPYVLDLYWRRTGFIDRSYNVFVHVVDAQGKLVAQKDGLPAGADYPTGYWGLGEVVRDTRGIELPPGAGPGEYHVLTGMYDASGARLPVFKGGERQPNDAAEVATFAR